MYMETLRGIAGIGIFPVLSLLLFVVVFGTMLVRVGRMDRASVQAFADLPLDRPGRRDGREEAAR